MPPEHQASNYRAVKAALFPHGKPDELILYRMRGEDEPEQAARDYEGVLPAQLDILLLGIGEDGHTASLFPGSPALQEWQRRVVTVVGSKPPPRRLSVTPAVIRAARHLLMLAKGESKAEAVRRALQEGDVPSALADTGDWLMDRGAAQALPAEE
ncbi:6-phosphogluconolactonase [endosymbiont of Riftia pachyptila]|uniref:6-phosphogluconolactonase n=1 Tax=endosymbiont of Riftia pachyptila (vent Ph05) TaxID=1048808 RepID=G2DBZ7_9GAMM|nr:6-phosphogluconolactonase [endosymbiont of Riftia pachyptila]EGV51886.1 6-phosphogluconolactonase [endosymbiont of Riftia pachyptila (vent Ph05)]